MTKIQMLAAVAAAALATACAGTQSARAGNQQPHAKRRKHHDLIRGAFNAARHLYR